MTDTKLADFLTDLSALVEKHLNGVSTTGKVPAKAAKTRTVVDEEDETEADPNAARRAELNTKTIAALRKLATAAGFEAEEVAGADKEEIVESLLADEDNAAEADEDEDEEAGEEEGEDEDEEEGAYSRDELDGLGLVALKKIAKEEYEQTTASLKGMDKETIVDLILGAEEEEEGDDEEEDEDEDLTEDDLNDMSLGELKETAKEYGVRVRPGMKKAALIEAIMGDDEEE